MRPEALGCRDTSEVSGNPRQTRLQPWRNLLLILTRIYEQSRLNLWRTHEEPNHNPDQTARVSWQTVRNPATELPKTATTHTHISTEPVRNLWCNLCPIHHVID
jgi:hypothetical protein